MIWIEAAAAAFGLACVWLTVRQNIWCWPVGLVQVGLYIVVFAAARLYSDALLHVIYVFLQLYGWAHWLHGGPRRSMLRVSTLSGRALRAWSALALLAALGWGGLMDRFTDAAAPYPDAFTTIASLIAQWLLARKKVESWYFWIAVDVVAIGVYLYKALYITAGLYAVFLVLATQGLLAWRRALLATSRPAVAAS